MKLFLSKFMSHCISYKKQLLSSKRALQYNFQLKKRNLRSFFTNLNEKTGRLRSYFHQNLWVARKIYQQQPNKHIDIGSRVDGFIGHLLMLVSFSIVSYDDRLDEDIGMDDCLEKGYKVSLFEFEKLNVRRIS